MGENSKIEWTDHTFNPWRGCTKVSPGCANCYAETLSRRNPAMLGEWGKGKPRVVASEAMWGEPLKWAKAAREAGDGRRPKVFCASLGDWLDDEVPITWLVRLLDLIQATPELDWLLLTKRPGNWGARVAAAEHLTLGTMTEKWLEREPPPNVWVGTSVEDQPRARDRMFDLLNIPARVRFLSCEPLLGSLDMSPYFEPWEYCGNCGTSFDYEPGREDVCPQCGKAGCMSAGFGSALREVYDDADGYIEVPDGLGIHWVICGGESGPGARPMHPDWALGLRDQCVAAGVPFFFKQWGEFRPALTEDFDDAEARIGWVQMDGGTHQKDVPMHEADELMVKVGKKAAGRLLDGRTWDEVPVLTGDAVPGATVKDGKGGEA